MAVLLASAVLASACAGPEVPPATIVTSDISCVDDSPGCIAARKRGLATLTADRNRSWMLQQPTAATYAAGVRLFAYRTQKSHLTCAELALAKAEASRGPTVLRSPAGHGLSPGQISRGVMFADEVARELDREQRKRCAGR